MEAAEFLSPELYMAYQEPQFIEVQQFIFERGMPDFGVDEPSTALQLFKKWDDFGLLVIHPTDHVTTGESGRVKIFNAYKNPTSDRQIGDRRERNAWESRLPGPSALLLVGPLISRLVVPKGYASRLVSLIALTTTAC